MRAFRRVGGVPRFIRSAQGATVEDVDGNRYLDFLMAWGPLIHGHRYEPTRLAVAAALERGWAYGATDPYSLELSAILTQTLPWVEKIRFVNSGTEAVMSALRVARAARQRDLILKLDGCYHGHVDSMLVRSGSGLAEMVVPDSAGVPAAIAGTTLVAPLPLADDDETYLEVLERHAEELAAVIVEPIPTNYGLLLPPVQFLPRLLEAARRLGVLVIFDEVVTGFRSAYGGMAEMTGLAPDLVTYAKVIGGGFSLAAYGGRRKLMDLVAPVGPVYQAGTYSANPVAVAASLATLHELRANPPYRALGEMTIRLKEGLERVAQTAGYPCRVQTHASIFWPVFGLGDLSQSIGSTQLIPTDHASLYSQFFHGLLEEGVFIAPSPYEVSFLSTAHESADLEVFFRAAKNAFARMAPTRRNP